MFSCFNTVSQFFLKCFRQNCASINNATYNSMQLDFYLHINNLCFLTKALDAARSLSIHLFTMLKFNVRSVFFRCGALAESAVIVLLVVTVDLPLVLPSETQYVCWLRTVIFLDNLSPLIVA